MLTAILLIGSLFLCALVLCVIVALDTSRVLAITDQTSWRCQSYRRALPSLLAILSRAGAPVPWPERVSGWSVLSFRRKLRRLLREEPNQPRELPAWHIGFWIHLRQHQTLIDFALSQEILESLSQVDVRQEAMPQPRVLEILHRAQARFDRLRPQAALELGPAYVSAARRLVGDLARIEIIYSEHGFHLSQLFAELREVQQACEDWLASPERGL